MLLLLLLLCVLRSVVSVLLLFRPVVPQFRRNVLPPFFTLILLSTPDTSLLIMDKAGQSRTIALPPPPPLPLRPQVRSEPRHCTNDTHDTVYISCMILTIYMFRFFCKR